jgi:hypothetical protein
MLHIFYVCYGCLDFCFIHVVLCAFTCVFVFCLAFAYCHRVYLCSSPSSRFSGHLRVLIDPLVVGRPHMGAFIYLLVFTPPLCGLSLCVRGVIAHLFLVLHIICLCADMFVLFVHCHVNFRSLWSILVCISRILLSPWSLRVLFLLECFTFSRFYLNP